VHCDEDKAEDHRRQNYASADQGMGFLHFLVE
jgi:hypothetical protein